jgi:predicted small lipoprotein YifL
MVRPFTAGMAAALLGVLVAGCGYKGPLTLPEKAGPVVIRPAPSATAPPAAPSTATPGDATPANPGAAPVSPVPLEPEDEKSKKPAPGASPSPGASPGSAPATLPATVTEGSPAGG